MDLKFTGCGILDGSSFLWRVSEILMKSQQAFVGFHTSRKSNGPCRTEALIEVAFDVICSGIKGRSASGAAEGAISVQVSKVLVKNWIYF